MAYDRDSGFEVTDDGIVLENGTHIISGVGNPSSIVPTNPTIYFQSNGAIWTHQGFGIWIRVGSLNFSFHKIDQPVTIPNGQQMITQGTFEITPNGSFVIEPEGKFRIREN